MCLSCKKNNSVQKANKYNSLIYSPNIINRGRKWILSYLWTIEINYIM